MTGQAEECEFVPGLVRLPNSETRRRNSETVNVSSGSIRGNQVNAIYWSGLASTGGQGGAISQLVQLAASYCIH